MKRRAQPHFFAFTVKYNGLADRIITEVSLTPAYDPKAHKQPPYPLFSTQALWDTGATNSMVTAEVAAAMNLVPIGRTRLKHGGGIAETNTYLVNMFLPNYVAVPGIQVAELPIIGEGFGVLVGMDIISKSDLSITNVGGETWMTFRIPSIERIDYVVEASKIKYAGVGRNDPCPCGSGKKFKQCCGRAVT
jgi:hypothetical protein